MNTIYLEALQFMEKNLNVLVNSLLPPKQVPFRDGFVFRYQEKTIQHAIVQKLARTISGLYAAHMLLEAGFLQEQGALQRMLDEFEEDIIFLSYAAIYNDETDNHKIYLDAFFEEEFDKPDDPIGSTQKRAMLPRQKIRAYIARMEEKGGLDRRRGDALGHTRSKAYSGYVHGASPHIMEMYFGKPPRFQVTGMRDTPLFLDQQKDIWNYFYRGLCAFAWAAMAFGYQAMCINVSTYCDQFAKANGEEYFSVQKDSDS